MGTVLREDGLRVVIYTTDHAPAHVHVFAGRHEAKIDLAGSGPELVYARGMTNGEVRRAMRLVTRKRGFLRTQWSIIHG